MVVVISKCLVHPHSRMKIHVDTDPAHRSGAIQRVRSRPPQFILTHRIKLSQVVVKAARSFTTHTRTQILARFVSSIWNSRSASEITEEDSTTRAILASNNSSNSDH